MSVTHKGSSTSGWSDLLLTLSYISEQITTIVKDPETYCKASLAISPMNFWAAMDTSLVLHIDNYGYKQLVQYFTFNGKNEFQWTWEGTKAIIERVKEDTRLKHPSSWTKDSIARVRIFTHGCQDTGIHFCSSNARQAHLESANDAYPQWLRNNSQHPETITTVLVPQLFLSVRCSSKERLKILYLRRDSSLLYLG